MVKRLGHSRVGWRQLWPIWPWRKLFYDPRPDLLKSKTRPPEWRKLESQWRFFSALFCFVGPPSHILWNIRYPYAAVMVVALSVAAVNQWGTDLATRVFDHKSINDVFQLSSYGMSLLLTFRVNRTYDRWNDARSSIAGVGNGATTVFLQAATWITNPALLDEFRRFAIVWPFAIMQTVLSEKSLHPVAAALLQPEELAIYSKSRKGRQVVVTKIRALAHEANLPLEQFVAMETAIAGTWTSAGNALRIKFQSMPLGLSLLCTGLILIWCMVLPFGLWAVQQSFWTIVPTAVISLLLLSCDEVSNQLENPFELMPLEDIMVTYERDINRVQAELAALREASIALRASAAEAAEADGADVDTPLPTSNGTRSAASTAGSARSAAGSARSGMTLPPEGLLSAPGGAVLNGGSMGRTPRLRTAFAVEPVV